MNIFATPLQAVEACVAPYSPPPSPPLNSLVYSSTAIRDRTHCTHFSSAVFSFLMPVPSSRVCVCAVIVFTYYSCPLMFEKNTYSVTAMYCSVHCTCCTASFRWVTHIYSKNVQPLWRYNEYLYRYWYSLFLLSSTVIGRTIFYSVLQVIIT